MQELLNNRYRIVQVLASGGCGQTFLAEDTHMPSLRKCVIKQLKPATQNPGSYKIIKERFEREAAILEMVSKHSGQIPTLHAYFTEQSEFYLVQDWIDGRDLQEYVRERGCLNEEQVRDFLSSILNVLDAIHSQGIIHRDIKPNNIMIRQRDNLPMLIDFGAVKEVFTTQEASNTASIVIGALPFMPPEQKLGHPEFASDIYAIGLTAIFMLTGKMPYEWMDERVPNNSWQALTPGVSQALANILNRAIEPNLADRFVSAKAMLRALEQLKPMPTALPLPAKPPNRHLRRGIVAALIVFVDLVILLAAGGTLYWYFSDTEDSNVRSLNGQITTERTLRIDAESKATTLKQQGDEGTRIKQALTDGKIWWVDRINNRTDLDLKFQILNWDGQWTDYVIKAGESIPVSRQNRTITIKFDSTPKSSGYAYKTYAVSGTAILGHEPTEADKSSAQLQYFSKDSSGNIDLYHP